MAAYATGRNLPQTRLMAWPRTRESHSIPHPRYLFLPVSNGLENHCDTAMIPVLWDMAGADRKPCTICCHPFSRRHEALRGLMAEAAFGRTGDRFSFVD